MGYIMEKKNEEYLQYYNSNNLSNSFLEIVKPLKNMMFKKDIYYSRVYKDGSIYSITTNKEWINNWLSYFNDFNDTFFQDKIKKSIPSVNNIYGAWSYNKHDPLLEFNHRYRIDQGFDIYTRKKDFVEMWAFSGSAEIPLFHDFCINNLCKIKEIIELCTKQLNHNKDLFFYKRANIPIDLSSNFSKVLLTVRETECARLLILGKTTKEIARGLNISPKTVEVYINNIKQKTGCHYKHDLIKFYQGVY